MDIKKVVMDSFEELGWTECPEDNFLVAELVEKKIKEGDHKCPDCGYDW